jgi:sugar-specific transcriptional regulator TrmB
MTDSSHHDEAIRLLQELGLREYEAKAFVALTRLPQGTAKEISEISDVPRTRVYDAVRMLESKGLVEIQHSNPQQFRAVSVEEATKTLQQEYETRTDSLRDALGALSTAPTNAGGDTAHEVWALSGSSAVTSRTQELIAEAEDEVVLVLGAESVLTGDLVANLRAAAESGTDIVVGTTAEEVRGRVQDELPQAEVFVSGLDWLSGADIAGDDTNISRLLLVDRSAILVSTFQRDGVEQEDHEHERAVFGRGFDNGLVTVARRLMETGLSRSVDGS